MKNINKPVRLDGYEIKDTSKSKSKIQVDYECEEYKKYFREWIKCTDCYNGQRAIKDKKNTYLPKLSGQEYDYTNNYVTANYRDKGVVVTTSEYESYLKRAVFYNLTKKVTKGLVEQLFRKNIQLKVPPKMQCILDKFTLDGKSFVTAVKESNRDILLNYRSILVLDFPKNDKEIKTIKDKEKANIRPYAIYYNASEVINWRYETINNKPELSLVVIRESIEDYNDNEFVPDLIEQYRVFSLMEGVYTVRIYRKSKKNGNIELVEQTVPVVNGKTLDFIPCYFITEKGISNELDYPLLNDIADLNIAHYINSADYENSLSITGSPTPVVKGLDDEVYENEPVALGNRVLKLTENGDAYYMEYKGLGPEALASAMDKKVDAMSVMAGKMLQNDPNGVESAETAYIHRAGEQGQLASMATSVSQAYEIILNQIADWMGVSGEIIIEFNTDYTIKELDPQLFANMNTAKEKGFISFETYFYLLLKNEMIKPGWTIEEEREAINSDMNEIASYSAGFTEDEDEESEEK